ncbi:hypothetical protein C8F01DRAFT_292951 [Mycena amicta]|nr:hypothetical protein C8F01DRAFT_292951 [Mycena amicta]
MTMTAVAALALALLPVALAQSTIDVQVGPSGSFTYDPPSVTAAAGDIVRFTFNPKNHTVTQSSFDEPCVPLVGGASSGFQFVSNVSGLLPTWTFAVANSSKPLWFHCEQTGHCGQGMVFAINAPAAPDPHSFESFQELAKELNGTTATATTTPPAQSWASATATLTHDASTWTTIYTSYDGTPQPTFAATPADHKIFVGQDGFTFTPANISASLGDTVTFEFHPKAHSVTQSSFSDPCTPLAQSSKTGQVGFNSGLRPVGQNDTQFPTFQITINDTAPIWGYCAQPGPPTHCSLGMVFSINAVESGPNNFGAFRTLAMSTDPNAGSSSGSSGSSGSGGGGTVSSSAPAPSHSNAAGPSIYAPASTLVLGVVAGVMALL